jgi:hypothetical protein
MSSAVNDNFSCYENSIIFSSALSLVAMMLTSCNSIPSTFAPDETATTGVTRRAVSEAPKIQSIQSVVDITNRILQLNVASAMHVYEVRPRKGYRGVDLISDVLPFGWLHALRRTVQCD